MGGRDYLQDSGIVDANNFVQVDKYTLRNPDYPNIWALGDGSNLPTSKTMSGVLDQVQVVTQNLADQESGRELSAHYDGYTGCPILVGGGKVLLAEFKYDAQIAPTFWRDQRKPTKLFYLLKQKIFPFAALNLNQYGIWRGRSTVKPIFDPASYDYSEFQAAQEEAERQALVQAQKIAAEEKRKRDEEAA